ncbi:5844_t:CDS:2, partial [Rhizophagus irregularis]
MGRKRSAVNELITMIMMIIKHQIDCFINLNGGDIKQLEIKEDEEALLEKLNDI